MVAANDKRTQTTLISTRLTRDTLMHRSIDSGTRYSQVVEATLYMAQCMIACNDLLLMNW